MEKNMFEDKLDKLAIQECDKLLKDKVFDYNDGPAFVYVSTAVECYKAGYRKAKDYYNGKEKS